MEGLRSYCGSVIGEGRVRYTACQMADTWPPFTSRSGWSKWGAAAPSVVTMVAALGVMHEGDQWFGLSPGLPGWTGSAPNLDDLLDLVVAKFHDQGCDEIDLRIVHVAARR